MSCSSVLSGGMAGRLGDGGRRAARPPAAQGVVARPPAGGFGEDGAAGPVRAGERFGAGACQPLQQRRVDLCRGAGRVPAARGAADRRSPVRAQHGPGPPAMKIFMVVLAFAWVLMTVA